MTISCPTCGGSKYIRLPEGGVEACDCTLKERALNYLTPIYANAKFLKDFKCDSLLKRNILVDGQSPEAFKTFVKSFLLNTGMKFSHKTKTAHDLLQAMLTESESGEWSQIEHTDILFIYPSIDPPNRSYGQIIQSMIEKRTLVKKPTWIFSQYPIKSQKFQFLYSEDLAKSIESRFTQLNP